MVGSRLFWGVKGENEQEMLRSRSTSLFVGLTPGSDPNSLSDNRNPHRPSRHRRSARPSATVAAE